MASTTVLENGVCRRTRSDDVYHCAEKRYAVKKHWDWDEAPRHANSRYPEKSRPQEYAVARADRHPRSSRPGRDGIRSDLPDPQGPISEVSLNMLYALEGTLTGRHWNSFTADEKAALRAEVAKVARIHPRARRTPDPDTDEA